MADKKISQLTELTSTNEATDFLPVVDTSAVETKKISLANLPLSDAAIEQSYPYNVDFQSGVKQTRNLTTITSSDGYYGNSNLTSVYVGSNVTSIGSSSFQYCSSLTSVTIPNSVTSLGSYAFAYCNGLTSVTIPNSITSISFYAFAYCNSLTSVTIPDSVTVIGAGGFKYCSSLTSATIGNGVTSIGFYAFGYCSSLATINCLATTAPTIAQFVFESVAASDIHVPVGATGYGTTYGGLTVVFDL
jgi:hypothetical protein